MVTIINGEIVPDDDPRAQAYRQRKNNTTNRRENPERRTPSRNQNLQAGGGIINVNTNAQNGGGSSIFNDLNNRLLQAGLPRLTVAGQVLEPVVLIGIILAGLFLGLRGLMLIGLIYFLVSRSGRGRGRGTGR